MSGRDESLLDDAESNFSSNETLSPNRKECGALYMNFVCQSCLCELEIDSSLSRVGFDCLGQGQIDIEKVLDISIDDKWVYDSPKWVQFIETHKTTTMGRGGKMSLLSSSPPSQNNNRLDVGNLEKKKLHFLSGGLKNFFLRKGRLSKSSTALPTLNSAKLESSSFPIVETGREVVSGDKEGLLLVNGGGGCRSALINKKVADVDEMHSGTDSSQCNSLLDKNDDVDDCKSERNVNVMSLIFEEIVRRFDIDVPLCANCSLLLIDKMDRQLESVDRQIVSYKEYMEQLEMSIYQMDILEQSVKSMKKRESHYTEQIEKLKRIWSVFEKEECQMSKDLVLLTCRAEYFRLFNMHCLDRAFLRENIVSVRNRKSQAIRWLEMLRESHVMNDAFLIYHDMEFGTISGLRLGRSSDNHVDWIELSAAYGYVMLLIEQLGKILKLSFTNIVPVVFGSFSGFLNVSRDTFYELHSDLDVSIVRLMKFNRFNMASVKLLQCILDIGESIASIDDRFSLPIPIVKGLIGGYTTKRIIGASDVKWTLAHKLLLINLKSVILWIISRCPSVKD